MKRPVHLCGKFPDLRGRGVALGLTNNAGFAGRRADTESIGVISNRMLTGIKEI
jgi:hypothetical protein